MSDAVEPVPEEAKAAGQAGAAQTGSATDRSFAELEYTSLSSMLSSGLQTMALLLTLYFLFTGAVFSAVLIMFSQGWGEEALFGANFLPWLDQRDPIMLAATAVAILFTVWAAFFVRSYSAFFSAAIARGEEIEAAAYVSAPETNSLLKRVVFVYEHEKWIARLSKVTTMFFGAVSVFWVLALVVELFDVNAPLAN